MTEEDVIWENTVDGGVWGCKVTRVTDYQGELEVWNVASNDVILSERVGLAYDAIFGPDVSDVAQWMEQTLAAIDAQEAKPE
jgi:hypothetical protein